MSYAPVLPEVRATRWLLAMLVSALSTVAQASDAESWRVWLDAKFLGAASTQPIPGAERTVLVAGLLEAGELRAFTAAEWTALGTTWGDFAKRARTNAATELASLKPEYTRNAKKVIEHAVMKSEEPIVSATVLAPGFRALFADTLGPKLIVVVPNRFTAYVFPHLVSSYRDYAPGVFADYRATAHPVSVEVFELSEGGLKATGAYEEP